jgi:hypothetical protein
VLINTAFRDDPAREERFKTVNSAILESIRSPTIRLNTRERTILLDSNSIVSRKSLSLIESGFAKRRARLRTLLVSLS